MRSVANSVANVRCPFTGLGGEGVGSGHGKCWHPTVFRPRKILAGPRTQDFKSASEVLKADVRHSKSGHRSRLRLAGAHAEASVLDKEVLTRFVHPAVTLQARVLERPCP